MVVQSAPLYDHFFVSEFLTLRRFEMKTTKSRIILFAIAFTYNLLLGLYLKDFLVLSQSLTAFYLLSVLPTLFLLIEPHSRAMRTIVYIVLALNILVNLTYFICCRRLIPVMTMLFLVTELMYFITINIMMVILLRMSST